MRFKDLGFQEISDTKDQAGVVLDCGYSIQVQYDRREKVYDAKLWDAKNKVIDAEDGLDKDDVMQFIEASEKLVEIYKETMEDCLELA